MCVCVACFLVGCDTEDFEVLPTNLAVQSQLNDSAPRNWVEALSDNPNLTSEQLATLRYLEGGARPSFDPGPTLGIDCDCSVSILNVNHKDNGDEDGYVRFFATSPVCPNPDGFDCSQFFLDARSRTNCGSPAPGCTENVAMVNGTVDPNSDAFNCDLTNNSSNTIAFRVDAGSYQFSNDPPSCARNASGSHTAPIQVTLKVSCVDQVSNEDGSLCNPPGGTTLYTDTKVVTLSPMGFITGDIVIGGCGCEPSFQ